MSVTEEASLVANDGGPGAIKGDEQGGMSLTGTPELLVDPAILAVNPKFRYEKDELLKLREVPLSQRKPDFLDVNEVSPTIWNFDRKKSETPIAENGARIGDAVDHRRRPGDPRERLRKENDGIVLSPQRRSFNSGCFVPVREPRGGPPGGRPHSPLGGSNSTNNKNDNLSGLSSSTSNSTSTSSSNRRIGSGRILRVCDFDICTDKSDIILYNNENEYNFRPQQPTQTSSQSRQSGTSSVFGRDFLDNNNLKSDQKDHRRNSGGSRFNHNNNHHHNSDRRRLHSDHNEEPEWFLSGPSSQNDTIELRGFDENERCLIGSSNKKKISPSQAKRARDWYRKKNECAVSSVKSDVVVEEEEKGDILIEGGPGGRSTPTLQASGGIASNGDNGETPPSSSANEQPPPNASNGGGGGDGDGNGKHQEKCINNDIFEDILKSDSIPGLPGLLTNGVGGDGDNGKSRFSKWFSVDTTGNNAESSRKSSMQDDSIIKNLLKDLNETTNVSIPGDSSSYFAPISPAANTTGPNMQSNAQKSINIMDMLQRGQEASSLKSVPGHIMHLNEIEAKMRQNSEPQMLKHQQKNEKDLAAFNRLLAHMSVNPNVSTNGPMSQKTQPMSLMEMLSHSQQQDEAHARMAQLLGPASPGASPHDLATRLQQQQQHQQQQKQVEMLTKLMNAGIPIRSSPLPDMGKQQSRELLSRPEAQAILQGLKIGDITPQHLYQQLANPALQPRHREMLVTILKLQGGGSGGGGSGGGGGNNSSNNAPPSPRVLSPVAPHPLFQQQQQQQHQQQQQLRVSPLPPNAYCVSPIMATSPNTLTVPALHQRIPSPRELQVHTQNILQRALIKKKLEEQQENYRKKQEMQQRGQSPNNSNNNTNSTSATTQQSTTNKSVSSPTPLAFTPTSVLRKMTAEKDDGGNLTKDVTKLVNDVGACGKLNQGRAVTGMRPQTQQQQQQQQQWNQFQQQIQKQAGRPIVKANNYQSPPQQSQEQFFTQQQQAKFFNQLQQQRKTSYGGPPSGHHLQQYSNVNQQFSQLTQQQLRAQHQQQARPNNQQQQQQQQQQGNGSWQQFLNPQQQQQQQSRGPQIGRGNGMNDGDLSPTSNQLTRWFSPDLLERARVGELPSTAGLSQHLLSLEEIERLSAPPVHN